jgi:hypothetical protein
VAVSAGSACRLGVTQLSPKCSSLSH